MDKIPDDLVTLFDRMKSLSADELNNHVANGLICVHNHIIGLSELKEIDLAGGWRILFTRFRGANYPRIAYLTGTTVKTIKLWQDGQVKLRVREGMSEEQALRWLGIRDCMRFDCLEHLYGALKDKRLLNAYLEIHPKMTSKQVVDWKRKHNIYDQMTAHYRIRFCHILRTIIDQPA